MSGTRTRVISGVVALVVVLPVLMFGGFLGVFALVGLAAGICSYEYVCMALPQRPRGTMALMMVLGLAFFSISAWSTSDVLDGLFGEILPGSMLLLVLLVLSAVVSSLWFMLTATQTDGLADRWARFMLGLVYVPLVLGLLPALLHLDGGQAEDLVAAAGP